MLSQMSTILAIFFIYWVLSATLSSKSLIWSSVSSNLPFIPFSVFLPPPPQILYSSFLTLFYDLYVLFHTVGILTKFFEYPYNHFFWTLYVISWLPSFHLAFFLWIFTLLFSFEACFFVSHFLLPFFVCFYALSRSTMTPSLSRVALCSRYIVGLSGAISLITWPGCFRNVPFVGYVGPLL